MEATRESSTESRTDDPFASRIAWRGGAVAGLVATVVMGIAISVGRIDTLRLAIAGLYGFEGSLVAGWVVHVLHGTLFGVLFAAVLTDPGLYRITDWVWKSVLAGVVYALVLALVGAGFVMPVWLDVVGFAGSLNVPNVTVPMLAWHVVYGVVLGLVFPFVEDL